MDPATLAAIQDAKPLGSSARSTDPLMSESARALHERIHTAYHQMKAAHEEMAQFSAAGKEVPGDVQQKWERAEADVQACEKAIQANHQREQRLSQFDSSLATIPAFQAAGPMSGGSKKRGPLPIGQCLRGMAMGNRPESMTQERVEAMTALKARPGGELEMPLDQSMYKFALDRTAGDGLEWTEQNLYMRDLMKEMELISSMRGNARLTPTSNGGTMHLPAKSDLTRKARIVGSGGDWEAASNVLVDPDSYENTMGEFKYVTASSAFYEQVRDNLFPLEQGLIEDFADGMARAHNEHATVGTGTGEPQGWVTATNLNSNADIDLGTAGSIDFDDLINLEHTLDPVMRNMGAVFMSNDLILKEVRKIRENNAGDGQYLWQPSQQVGHPGSVHGFPWLINQDMASVLTTGTQAVVGFGIFSRAFYIRDIGSVRVRVLDQARWNTDEIVYVMFWSFDCRLRSRATNTKPPIVVLDSP